jgi:hypothetical protein
MKLLYVSKQLLQNDFDPCTDEEIGYW